MIIEREGEERENMGENKWWGRGSFKTRDMYREVGKELKRGSVVAEGEQTTGQASYIKKCKKKDLVEFN